MVRCAGIAKNLYLDDDYMLELECKSTLVNGACPREHASFFAYSRHHGTSKELRTRIMREITQRTHDCYDNDVTLAAENGEL